MQADGLLYDFAHVGHGSVDALGRIVAAQPSLQRLLRAGGEPVEGRRLVDFFHADDRPQCAASLQQAWESAAAHLATRPCELRLLPDQENTHWVDLAISSTSSGSGDLAEEPGARTFLLTDISARKQAEAALQQSETMLKDAQATAQLGSFHWDAQTNKVTWSDELFRIYGRSPGHFVPTFQTYLASVHPQDMPRVQQRLQEAIDTRTDFAHDYRLLQPDGRLRWVHARGRPVIDAQGMLRGLQGTCQDITARKQVEEALQESLKDKEALLRELHHRVKNNLQLVSSLLRLENQRPSPRDTQDVLAGMQGRIRSMALLHETMYHPGVFASVDLGVYLRELASQAFQAQVERPDSIRLELELQPLQLGMDQAMPSGLLVNELVCNSLKHGFPGQHTGVVRVRLQPVDDARTWCLEVSDTGVGLPADFAEHRQNSLGLHLAADLADQMGGQLHIRQGGAGALFSVVFEPVANNPLPAAL